MMLLQMVSFCCYSNIKSCSFGKIIKGMAFLLLGLLCITINYYVVKQLREDNQSSLNYIHDLLTSLVSSVIIGLTGI